MKKYFIKRMTTCVTQTICQDEIDSYRSLLIVAMKKNGATDSDLNLIHDATIKNSIRNKRNPEDVAWAILQ